MNKDSGWFRLPLFVVFSFCLAVYVDLLGRLPGFSILDHAYVWRPGRLAIAALILFPLLLGAWALTSGLLSAIFKVKHARVMRPDFWTYLPVLLFGAAPLALRRYLDRADLGLRLTILAAIVIGAVLVLNILLGFRLSREKEHPGRGLVERFGGRSRAQRLTLLVVAALLVFNAGALVLDSRRPFFSGDEPHYLLIAHSLIHDRDFDLKNNYAERDYDRTVLPGSSLSRHVIKRDETGPVYSFHSPGTAFVLLPFYALGDFVGPGALRFLLRFGMSLLGALFGLQIYLFARKEWGREGLALGLWFLTSFTAPVFFYSIHVYPELIVAFLSLMLFRLIRHSESWPARRVFAAGLICASLIWFHALKYIFLMAPLFVYFLWVLLKKHRRWKALPYALAGPLLSGGLYLLFQFSLYGSLSLSSVSWKGPLSGAESVSYAKYLLGGIPFRFRLETLAGYFFDQRDGLLFYAPIYILAFLGAVELLKRKRSGFWTLAFVTAPYILASAFLTQRTGYAPQARPLVAVIWGLAIWLGAFIAANRKTLYSSLLAVAAVASLVVVVLLLLNPAAIYQETTEGTTERGGALFVGLSNLHLNLRDALPSYIRLDGGWLPNVVWPGVVALLVLAFIIWPRKKEWRPGYAARTVIVLALAGLLAFWLVCFPRGTLADPVRTEFPDGGRLDFANLSRAAQMTRPGRFLLVEDDRVFHFSFTSRQPLREMGLEFGSTAGSYAVGLSLFDRIILKDRTRREFKTVTYVDPPFYRLGRLYLYRLDLNLRRRSAVVTGDTPYLLAVRPVW